MGNPNTSRRLRRHNSLPSKLQPRSSFMPRRLRMKTNPYVGNFAHSPPTTFRSMEASVSQNSISHSTSHLRNSPYIGWFRHSPPSSVRSYKVDQKNLTFSDKYHQYAMMFDALPRPEDTPPHLAQVINGRLCGGGKDRCYSIQHVDSTSIINSVHKALEESSNASSSPTVKVLAKLGAWFLFPLAYDSQSCGHKDYDLGKGLNVFQDDAEVNLDDSSYEDDSSDAEDDAENDSEDEESSIALSDFDRSLAATPLPLAQQPLGVSISEIAEAYYAHQVLDQSDYSNLNGHRVDYVITQMDIARMARNASRHLDVDSILNLPTTTYRSPVRIFNTPTNMRDSRDPDEAWSFIMVPQEKSVVQQTVLPTSEESTCVICLEQFKDGDRLRVLPCDHSFHVGCIDRWLSGSHSHHECFTSGCPTCKKSPTEHASNDGSVPSWAFAKLGAELARS